MKCVQVLRKWKCRWNESVMVTSAQAQQVTKCIAIAESCMEKEPKKRPSICDVIRDLNEIGNTNSDISAIGQVSSSLLPKVTSAYLFIDQYILNILCTGQGYIYMAIVIACTFFLKNEIRSYIRYTCHIIIHIFKYQWLD